MMRDTRVNGTGIGVYFWHNDTDRDQMPSQVAAPIHEAPTSLDGDHMEKWGKPQAYFGYNDGSNIQCDFENKFGLHEIIFDTTLCGTWTNGPGRDTSGCPVSCKDYLINHGDKFADARWEIEFVRLYSNGCEDEPDQDDDSPSSGGMRIYPTSLTWGFTVVMSTLMIFFGSMFL